MRGLCNIPLVLYIGTLTAGTTNLLHILLVLYALLYILVLHTFTYIVATTHLYVSITCGIIWYCMYSNIYCWYHVLNHMLWYWYYSTSTVYCTIYLRYPLVFHTLLVPYIFWHIYCWYHIMLSYTVFVTIYCTKYWWYHIQLS